MFLARIVFRALGVVQIECIDLTDQECFDTRLIALLRNLIGLIGYGKLLCLIVEMLDQQEDVLIEIHLFLLYLGQGNVPVTLGYPHFSTAFAPVEDWNFNTDLNHLIV